MKPPKEKKERKPRQKKPTVEPDAGLGKTSTKAEGVPIDDDEMDEWDGTDQVDSLISSLQDDHAMDDQDLEFLDDDDEVRSLLTSK